MTKSTFANHEKISTDLRDRGISHRHGRSYDPTLREDWLAFVCLMGTTEPIDFEGHELLYFNGSEWLSLFEPQTTFKDGDVDEESTRTSPGVPLRRDSHHGVKP